MALTEEEKAEIAAYAAEEAENDKADAERAERQHLEALRLRKRFEKEKGWKHEIDFLVLEANRGGADGGGVNLVLRQPTEAECEMVEDTKDPAAWEAFTTAIVIHPPPAEFLPIKIKFPGVAGAVVRASNILVGQAKVANAKK